MSQQRPSGGGAPEPGPLRGMAIWPLMLLGMVGVILYVQGIGEAARAEPIDYSEFMRRVRDGGIEHVDIYKERMIGKWRDPQKPTEAARSFVVSRDPGGNLEKLEGDLEARHIDYGYKPTSQLQAILVLFVFLVGISVVFLLIARRVNPAERAMAFGKSRARQYVERDTRVTFDDVAGIDEPKAELLEIVEYLRTPDKFRRLGGKIPKGVLLVGAPGTGKTLLAKAVAGEARVAFFSMSGSDFVELFVGVGASRVRDLFRQAEQHSPCIVFIDELDALGKARGGSLIGGGHDEREQTLNQLLVEMDGFDSRLNVIVMAATNRPEILDTALLRPGRFDRQIVIPAPDIVGREAILRVHCRTIQVDPALDLRRVAQRTPGFVGADLANVVNEAALLAARREREHVVFEDFDEAIDRVSIGLERKSHVMSDEVKRLTAYHEAGHAVVAMYCPQAATVHKVSIIPRGWTGGVTQMVDEDERHVVGQGKLEAMLATGLGGRSAEELVFGEVSTGASNDIRRVTDLARAMVTELGMSSELGPLNYSGATRTDPYGLAWPTSREVSEDTARRIDAEVRRIVDLAQEVSRRILSEHRAGLEALAQRLLEVEVVDQAELCRVLGLPLPEPPAKAQAAEPEIPSPDDGAGGTVDG